MLGLIFMIIIGFYWLLCLIAIKKGIKRARELGHKGWKGGLIAGLIMYNLIFWDVIPVYAIHYYQCEKHAGFKVYKTPEQWKQDNPGIAEMLSVYSSYEVQPSESALPPHNYLYKTTPSKKSNTLVRKHYRYPSGYEVIFDYNINRKEYKSTTEIIPPQGEQVDGYYLNARFAELIKYEKVWHVIHKTDEKIIDLQTGEVLAEYINFDGNPSQFVSANSWNDYKFWLAGAESCEQITDGTIVYQESKNSYQWVGNGSPPIGYQFNKLKSQFKNINDGV